MVYGFIIIHTLTPRSMSSICPFIFSHVCISLAVALFHFLTLLPRSPIALLHTLHLSLPQNNENHPPSIILEKNYILSLSSGSFSRVAGYAEVHREAADFTHACLLGVLSPGFAESLVLIGRPRPPHLAKESAAKPN